MSARNPIAEFIKSTAFSASCANAVDIGITGVLGAAQDKSTSQYALPRLTTPQATGVCNAAALIAATIAWKSDSITTAAAAVSSKHFAVLILAAVTGSGEVHSADKKAYLLALIAKELDDISRTAVSGISATVTRLREYIPGDKLPNAEAVTDSIAPSVKVQEERLCSLLGAPRARVFVGPPTSFTHAAASRIASAAGMAMMSADALTPLRKLLYNFVYDIVNAALNALDAAFAGSGTAKRFSKTDLPGGAISISYGPGPATVGYATSTYTVLGIFLLAAARGIKHDTFDVPGLVTKLRIDLYGATPSPGMKAPTVTVTPSTLETARTQLTLMLTSTVKLPAYGKATAPAITVACLAPRNTTKCGALIADYAIDATQPVRELALIGTVNKLLSYLPSWTEGHHDDHVELTAGCAVKAALLSGSAGARDVHSISAALLHTRDCFHSSSTPETVRSAMLASAALRIIQYAGERGATYHDDDVDFAANTVNAAATHGVQSLGELGSHCPRLCEAIEFLSTLPAVQQNNSNTAFAAQLGDSSPPAQQRPAANHSNTRTTTATTRPRQARSLEPNEKRAAAIAEIESKGEQTAKDNFLARAKYHAVNQEPGRNYYGNTWSLFDNPHAPSFRWRDASGVVRVRDGVGATPTIVPMRTTATGSKPPL